MFFSFYNDDHDDDDDDDRTTCPFELMVKYKRDKHCL